MLNRHFLPFITATLLTLNACSDDDNSTSTDNSVAKATLSTTLEKTEKILANDLTVGDECQFSVAANVADSTDS